MAHGLILTHEHADFDAIAALVAAAKLYPDARPVRPRKVNRNVLDFLTLYGGELGLLDLDSLTRKSVPQVVLVDAQGMSAVRGVKRDTPVHVIDHHPGRELAEHWTQQIEPVGATVTLLVEHLKSRHLTLTPVEATLLLLGLYEDTGNLSYLTTTARDALAAAWILSFEPDLTALREFLNKPLDEQQEALYTALLTSAVTHSVAGHDIMVCKAALQDRAEISGVVHHLRDRLDLAAIIAVVQVGRSVSLVARSATEAIDVGVIARHFGGGGHGRAAAARIEKTTADGIVEALPSVLPDAVKPPLTVADLMSRGAQTLPCDLPVHEAAAHLQRYGHEGDLVVDDAGKVVGLITRTAVDRAMAHNLRNERIEHIMDKGAVQVGPDDSVPHLREVMKRTGWGQVPVIEHGQLVGIVTRTDLLRQWAERPANRPHNLAAVMASALTPSHMRLLEVLAASAKSADLSLFVVGGFVRDLLLNRPSIDFDFVVEGDAIALGEALQRAHGGELRSHRQFGTAKWLLPPDLARELGLDTVDLVSARQEFYAYPAALPKVEHRSIKHDLHRRDFTINTLAIQINGAEFGRLLDYYGGQRDLRTGQIRVLHSLSFVDDPTRLVRAVRHATRFDFDIEQRTAELMTQALPMLDRVSGDRIRHELEAVFKEQDPAHIIAALDERGILAAIHPALRYDADLPRRLAGLPAEASNGEKAAWGMLRWLGTLPPDEAGIIASQINLPARLAKHLAMVCDARAALTTLPPDAPLSAVDVMLYGLPDAAREVLPTVLDEARAARVAAWTARLAALGPPIGGETVIGLGVPRGPLVGQAIDELRRAQLDGQLGTDEVAVERWLAAWLATTATDPL